MRYDGDGPGDGRKQPIKGGDTDDFELHRKVEVKEGIASA